LTCLRAFQHCCRPVSHQTRAKTSTTALVHSNSGAMLSGTNLLACQARVGFTTFKTTALCLIVCPRKSFYSRAAPVVVATSAAAAPATATPTAAQPQQLQAPLPGLSFADRPGIWDSDSKLQLKNLTFEELQEWCESMGESRLNQQPATAGKCNRCRCWYMLGAIMNTQGL
jgi:hypothetical protein